MVPVITVLLPYPIAHGDWHGFLAVGLVDLLPNLIFGEDHQPRGNLTRIHGARGLEPVHSPKG